ncbi:hypothetical protein SHINM1_018050 [Fluviibacter phosphoraccumulans]|nr:hypothetical protein SHINM1_018050 [Fluviibacter phosphoraccumulans]
MRSGGYSYFHALPYYYSVCAIIAYATLVTIPDAPRQKIALLLIPTLFAFYFGFQFERVVQDAEKSRVPLANSFSKFVQFATDPEDPILSYSFNNYDYIVSGRLPAHASFFYMPWQFSYSKNPVLGVNTDPCINLHDRLPKIFVVTKLNVWGKFPWETYSSCIDSILDANYTMVKDSLYVRNDSIPVGLLSHEAGARLGVSHELAEGAPISLKLAYPNLKLRKIGIRFGTYIRENAGEAALSYVNQTGSLIQIPFDLSALHDNSYYYFDIQDDVVSNPLLTVKNGGGVSVWEVETQSGNVFSCANYVDINNKRYVTPNCLNL